jgi:uncharacterized protein
MRKAVLDTNILVSAFLFFERGGVPVALLRKAAEGRFTLVTCRALLDELEHVLVRDPAVRERYGYTPEMAAAYRALLQVQATVVEPQPPFPRLCRDPDDDVLLATAVLAAADYLVTGDNDLLSLGTYQGIGIVTPRDFLERL